MSWRPKTPAHRGSSQPSLNPTVAVTTQCDSVSSMLYGSLFVKWAGPCSVLPSLGTSDELEVASWTLPTTDGMPCHVSSNPTSAVTCGGACLYSPCLQRTGPYGSRNFGAWLVSQAPTSPWSTNEANKPHTPEETHCRTRMFYGPLSSISSLQNPVAPASRFRRTARDQGSSGGCVMYVSHEWPGGKESNQVTSRLTEDSAMAGGWRPALQAHRHPKHPHCTHAKP